MKCQALKKDGDPCQNGGYYKYKEQILCGVHSRKYSDRITLPKQRKEEFDLKKHMEECNEIAEQNKKKGITGDIKLTRMRFFKKVPIIPGYINVFPNYKHGKRKDGYGMPELYPMSLGPVEHGQPGLPLSRNIENFHQGNKCFQQEYVKNEEITRK